MSFALPPKQINSLQYTGENLFTIPAVNFNRAPNGNDINYPLFTVWRNNDINAVLPDALGDAWLLVKFNATVQPFQAVWIKFTGGAGTIDQIDVDAHTAPGTDPVVPTAGGVITVTGAQVPAGAVGLNVIRTDSLAANTYTIEIQRTAAVAAPAPANNGVSHFNSGQFTVDMSGFVSLAGGGQAIDQINVDAHTAPGTDPVLPDGAGQITVTGGQVAAGTVGANVIRTDSLAANAYTIEVQRSAAVGVSASANNGVSHFNSANFAVDGNGFVSLLGGGAAVDSLTGDDGMPVAPDAFGNINVTGQNPALVSGVETYFVGANDLGVQLKSPFRGDFEFDNIAAATPRSVVIANADNTSALSTAEFQTLVDPASVADSYFNAAIAGTRSYAMGIDASDADSFKLTTVNTSGANPSSASVIMRSNTVGQINYPLQPCFVAGLTAVIAAVTGDGTEYTIVYDTESVDQSNSFDPVTGTFTAPIAGNYLFTLNVALQGIVAANTAGLISITAGGGGAFAEINPFNTASSITNGNYTLTRIIPLAAGTTVVSKIRVSGGAKVASIGGNSQFCYFCGHLLS